MIHMNENVLHSTKAYDDYVEEMLNFLKLLNKYTKL